VPTEFYLIIFLLVAMLVFAYFYSERAQARRARTHEDAGTSTAVDADDA
jgi:preprotein translocase subunit YajC